MGWCWLIIDHTAGGGTRSDTEVVFTYFFFKVPKASCCLLGWAGTIVWPTGQWILNENLWYNLLTYWSGSAKGKLIIIVHQNCKKEIDSSSSRCSNYDIHVAPRNLTQSFILCFYERALTGRAGQWWYLIFFRQNLVNTCSCRYGLNDTSCFFNCTGQVDFSAYFLYKIRQSYLIPPKYNQSSMPKWRYILS